MMGDIAGIISVIQLSNFIMSFQISISNDGNIFSNNSLLITIYDSNCYSCNSDTECTENVSTALPDLTMFT